MGIVTDIVLIVVAAFIGGLVAYRLKQPLLVGYILGGILVGPQTSGPKVADVHEIELLAEIGVALLLFTLGLEVSLKSLRPVKWVAIAGGPLQIILTTVFGYLVGENLLNLSRRDAIWFGSMISISSTMVVVKTLAGRSSTLASRIMIGILIIQDLAVVPMLIVLPKLSSPDGIASAILGATAEAALFLVLMLLVGTRIIPALFHRIAKLNSRELFLVSTMALAVGVGFGTHALGLSFALGAFVAGMVLSESELSHRALSDIAPLRDIFGLIFFASVGMLFDPVYLLENWGTVLVVCSLVLVGKFFILYFLTRVFGYVNKAPTLVGLRLAPIGEFSFVVARVGLDGGHVTPELYSLMITTTVLTLVLSPMLFKLDNPVHRFLSSVFPQKRAGVPFSAIVPELTDHVIVAGYGRTGNAVASVLKERGIPFIVIDSNHQRITNQGDLPYVWGDASKEEILSAAGVDTARCLVVTVPNSSGLKLTVERARALNGDLQIFCRAMSLDEIDLLEQYGVQDPVLPEYEAGRELGERAYGLYELVIR